MGQGKDPREEVRRRREAIQNQLWHLAQQPTSGGVQREASWVSSCATLSGGGMVDKVALVDAVMVLG